jgi:hypothetical protein
MKVERYRDNARALEQTCAPDEAEGCLTNSIPEGAEYELVPDKPQRSKASRG